MNPVESTRAELAQTQLQLHQLVTAMHRQIGALDTALHSIEQTMAQLSESAALPEAFASEHARTLSQVRGAIVSTATLLQWRLHTATPPGP